MPGPQMNIRVTAAERCHHCGDPAVMNAAVSKSVPS